MSETDDAPAMTTLVKAKPQFWRVVLTHPSHHGQTVFRSVSEKRARTWLVAHCPRGSEMHLVDPSGGTHSYEHERQGENGTDTDSWDPFFDPSTWIPVDQAPPPGDSEWADKEG